MNPIADKIRAEQNGRRWYHKSGVIVRVSREALRIVPDLIEKMSIRAGDEKIVFDGNDWTLEGYERDCVLVKVRRVCDAGKHEPSDCASPYPPVREACMYPRCTAEEWFDKYDASNDSTIENLKSTRRIAL